MKPTLIKSIGWFASCDFCESQEEGGHYCLLHSCIIKNMDTVRCEDYKPRNGSKTRKEGGIMNHNKKLATKIARRILKMNEPRAEEAYRIALMYGKMGNEYTRGGKDKLCLILEIEEVLNGYNHFTLPKRKKEPCQK